MKIKEGAILSGLHPMMRRVLIEANQIWKEHGQELAVTSGLDGTHSAGSAHYYGCAVDLRTRYFSDAELASVMQELTKRLPTIYYIKLEKDHIHVHYEHPNWFANYKHPDWFAKG